MNPEDVHERVLEFSRIRQGAGKDEAALLEVALFVEDEFGLILSDDEICQENLGSHQATESLVIKKLGLG